jgi:hypothetical protein
VRAENIVEFEKSCSAAGSWATLFRGSAGYLGTMPMRDSQIPNRYLTIDRSDSAASYGVMPERFAKDYEALDRACEAFTESEKEIGVFEDA